MTTPAAATTTTATTTGRAPVAPAGPPGPVLRLAGVTHRYPNGYPALCGVDLDVRAGEVLAVVGASGSGKTTLLNVMGGLTTPTEGTVLLGGRELSSLPDRRRAALRARHLGFVFQDFLLLERVPALDAVAGGLLYRRVPIRRRRERARAALAEVGLSARAHHRPHQLSGGEKQRVAVARALVGDPAVVLADEPTGNLDSRNGALVVELLRAAAQRGRAVVLVTHDREVAAVADRAVVVRDGRVAAR